MTVARPISEAMNHSSRWSRTFIARYRSDLRGIEAGFLVDRLQDLAADARLHLLVNLRQGALPRQPLFLRQGQDLGLAGGPDLGQRVFVVLEGAVVGELGRFEHGLVQLRADVG